MKLGRALIDDLGPDDLRALAKALAPFLPAAEPHAPQEEGWLATPAAARYAGCSVHSLRRAMASRELHFEQPSGPRGKAYFRRADLDAWRQGDRAGGARDGGRRAA